MITVVLSAMLLHEEYIWPLRTTALAVPNFTEYIWPLRTTALTVLNFTV